MEVSRREILRRLGGLVVALAAYGGSRLVLTDETPAGKVSSGANPGPGSGTAGSLDGRAEAGYRGTATSPTGDALAAPAQPPAAQSSGVSTSIETTSTGSAGASSNGASSTSTVSDPGVTDPTVSHPTDVTPGAGAAAETGDAPPAEAPSTTSPPPGGLTVAGAGALQLAGVIGPLLIPIGASATIVGNVELRGDLVVEGVLTGIDTFALNGNGYQIEVRNGGRLDLRGKPKSGWVRGVAPSGWERGDRVVTAPTARGAFGRNEFRVGAWPTSAGSATALVGGGAIAPEQFNLDRSIVISNLSRIIFHSGAGVQVLKHIAVRDSGVVGRLRFYPIHFHANGNYSRGSLIEGVVVEGGKNHAFVPHGTRGITFRDCVAFDTLDTAFWYDPPDLPRDPANNANDTVYQHCLVAYVAPSSGPGYRLSGFMLGAGSGNVCVDCTAVGVQGSVDASGFTWPEDANDNAGGTVWTFRDCVAHNNRVHGIFTWQNDSGFHPIERFVAYRNGDTGIDHGAYVNRYRYAGLTLSENGVYSIQSHALGRGDQIVFQDAKASEPLLIAKHSLEGGPVVYRNLAVPLVVVDERSDGGSVPSRQVFEDCGLTPDRFDIRSAIAGTTLEVYEGGALRYLWNGVWQ